MAIDITCTMSRPQFCSEDLKMIGHTSCPLGNPVAWKGHGISVINVDWYILPGLRNRGISYS